MAIRKFIRPTNRRMRWVVGLGLLALVCIQCASQSENFLETELLGSISQDAAVEPEAAKREKLAKTDHIALLKLAAARYDRTVSDYTCTFIKRERLHGKLGAAQEIQVKFLDKPFSVAMRWTRNAPIGDRVLYVEGKHGGNMLIRPKGLLSWVGTVKRRPDSPAVMSNTLRPISMFGFRRGLNSLLAVYETAKARGDLQFSLLGYKDVAGRKALVLSRLLPAKDEYPVAKTLIYLDVETLLPICIEAWDWQGNLESRYVYKDIEFNVGLTEADFEPAKNGL